jgi:hypothetical protein
METGPMRELMKRFEKEKVQFSLSSHDVHLDLPAPLNMLNIDGRVKEGELTIYMYGPLREKTRPCVNCSCRDEMRGLFNPSINSVVGLVEAQTKQLGEGLGRRLKVGQV